MERENKKFKRRNEWKRGDRTGQEMGKEMKKGEREYKEKKGLKWNGNQKVEETENKIKNKK